MTTEEGDAPGVDVELLQVLSHRRAARSRADSRDDDLRVALVIEGGGNRAAYSAGMALALDQAGLVDAFDAVYGTSGGALNAAWLLTGQGSRWLPSWAWPQVARAGVTNPWRLLRGQALVDLRVLVHHVYEAVTPMDFETILAHPTTFHPVATDAATGEATDLAPSIHDRATLQTALRASGCLPLLAGRPVVLDGRSYLDGGLSESIPYRMALAHGATHVLVLRTRREDQRARAASKLERAVLAPYFRRHGPQAGTAHAARHRRYAADDAWLNRVPGATAPTHVVQVRPPGGAPDVSRLSRDLTGIRQAIDLGQQTMAAVLARGNLGPEPEPPT